MLFSRTSASFSLDLCDATLNRGIASAARMPMITTTIMSSIRVNPRLFMVALIQVWRVGVRTPEAATAAASGRQSGDQQSAMTPVVKLILRLLCVALAGLLARQAPSTTLALSAQV